LTFILVLGGSNELRNMIGFTVYPLLSSVFFAFIVFMFPLLKGHRANAIFKFVKTLRQILSASVVNWIPLLIDNIGAQIGTVIVLGIQGPAEAGIYFIAFQITVGISVVIWALESVTFPALSSMNEGRKMFLWRVIKIGLIIVLPLSLSLLFYSKNIIQISGKVTFNSSFLTSSMPYDYNEPYLINTSRISIFKSGADVPIVLNNASIKDLKVTGDHEGMIDIMGTLELPDVRSNRDYFGIQIPTGSNMALKLSPNGIGNMEIVTQNESSVKSISFSNDSRVEIYNVKAPSPWKLIPILLKEPKMSVDGSIRIKHAYLSGFINERGRLDLGPPVDFRGNLETKLELVDNFNQPYRNTTSSTSVTYLQTLVEDGTFSQDKDDPKLPGDIYFGAKQRGQEIPLEKILTSPSNIITVIGLITVTIIVSKVIWRRKYS
jgi:hypothetical protein